MFPQTYLDFDVALQAVDHRYAVRVLASPAGEASGKFVLPFSAADLHELPAQLDTLAKIEAFGSQLFTTIFTGELLAAFRRSHEFVLQHRGGLRIRLRLDNSALAQLPWEYLYDPDHGNFLALSETTPLVRHGEMPRSLPPRSRQAPLHILVVTATLPQLPPLDSSPEWMAIQQALDAPVQQEMATITRFQGSLPALQQLLQTHDYHVLHFSGPGRFDESAQEGLLYLPDETGANVAITGRQLRILADEVAAVSLVVLNAGESGRAAPTNRDGGIAQSLIQQGASTVIAMQFPIQEKLAVTFAQAFYTALANNTPLEVALTRARKAIYVQGDPVGWGAPVLLTCAHGGQFWATDRTATANEVRPERPTFWQKLGFRARHKS